MFVCTEEGKNKLFENQKSNQSNYIFCVLTKTVILYFNNHIYTIKMPKLNDDCQIL